MSTSKNGKLTIYVDCVSPYSWFGFTNLKKFRPNLVANGIEVEILPFFLGAARDGKGNPWQPTPKYKEAFQAQDSELNSKLLGITLKTPEIFPISSLFPVRVATYIKDHYPADKFEATFESLVSGYWGKGVNVSKPEGIHTALDGIFGAKEVDEIMKKALNPENKKRVIDITGGSEAFGAPWIVGINKNGEKRMWFGNDRWEQVFFHLGVPYQALSVLPPGEGKAKL
ncbi:glutathione S-transferase [Paraphoma chrysanthemicola]|uniref:Glutathione S-transferase n=1 Tax=Paraphoma chrysanthemicola TaxID=798071 RepID=A0A8K0W0G1_9PLEO|nr:glutathione S-transferase [Paraphoma chrysanthemicola]